MKKGLFIKSEKIRYKNELLRCGSIPENDRKLIRLLKTKKLPESYCLLTIAAGPGEYLDIWSGRELKKDSVVRHLPYIVGVADSYRNAVALVISLLEEAASKGEADLNQTMKQKLNMFLEEEHKNTDRMQGSRNK